MDSDQKLFEGAVRSAYLAKDWLRVAYEGVNGNCLMINRKTGECRGGFLGMKVPYTTFKSKVIKELRRQERERGKRDSIIKKNAPIINEIEGIRSSTPKAKQDE